MSPLELLKRPHPFIFNKSSVLLPGAITFLLIMLIAPFGMESMSVIYRAVFAMSFGVIASLSVIFVVTILKRAFPRWIAEDTWTVGKELTLVLSVLFFITLWIYSLFLWFDLTQDAPIDLFIYVSLRTLAISLFPIIILILFEQYTHLREKSNLANKWNHELSDQKSDHVRVASEKIAIEAENGKVELRLAPEEILMIKSEGNYVEVYYKGHDGSAEKSLIRNRLKYFIESLPEEYFFHVHKSYLINFHNVVKVEGNARNYELVMRDLRIKIPVSRTKASTIQELLKM